MATFQDTFDNNDDIAEHAGTETSGGELQNELIVADGEVIQFVAASTEYGQIDSAAITTTTCSFECLFRVNSLGIIQTLLWCGDKDVIAQFLELRLSPTNTIEALAVAGGGGSIASSSTVVAIGRLYHAIAVFAGDSVRHIYVNGVNEGTNTDTVATVGFDRTTMGRRGDSTPNGEADVDILFANFYDYALTAVEASQLSILNTGNVTPAVSQYDIDTGSGDTLFDSGSNGFDLDMTGHAGTWITGDQLLYTLRGRATSTDLMDGQSAIAINSLASTIGRKSGGRELRVQFSDDNFTTIKNSNGDSLINAGGFSVDGVNDTLKNSTANFRSGDSAGTIAGYIFNRSVQEGAVFAAGDEAGTDNHFFVGTSPTGGFRISVRIAGTSNEVNTTADFPLNRWYHVAYVSSGTAWTILVNGVSVPLTVDAGSNTGDWLGDHSTLDNLTIGYMERSSNVVFLDGILDDIRVYSDALTATQVFDLYSKHETGGTLVNHWKLDGNGTDSVGSLTMTITGATSVTDWFNLPAFGEALGDTDTLSFDGVDDKARATVVNYRGSDSLGTITGWIWIDSASSPSGTNTIFASNDEDTAGLHRLIFYYQGSSATLRVFWVDGGTANLIATDAAMPTEQWVHVTLVSTGTAYLLYFKGVLQAHSVSSGSDNGNWFADIVGATCDNITIGYGANDTDMDFLGGRVANVAVYSTVLSAATILTDSQTGLPSSSGRVSFWPMNETSGDLLDADGSDDMTVTGATRINTIDRPVPDDAAQATIDVSGLSFTSSFYVRTFLQSLEGSRGTVAGLEEYTVDFDVAAAGGGVGTLTTTFAGG